MLVLRKELKMGLGVGAAVLGVATVYGLMSLLSSGGEGEAPVAANSAETLRVDVPRPIESARSGLPPTESEELASTPVPGNSTVIAPGDNTESARADGSGASATDDPWTISFRTGRTPDTIPAHNRNLGNTPGAETATVIQTPPLGTGPVSVGTSDRTGTPDRVDTRTVSEPATPAAGKYVVQPGDTYSSIAGKLYGNRNLYHAIERANPSIDPRKIRPGMELNVPAKHAVTSERGAVDVTPPVTATGTIDASREYRIQPGDTLHKISQRLYGKTNRWAAIYDLNKAAIGPDAGKLKVGTVLLLPETPVQR